MIDIDNFKLILHSSFASKSEAIGLELIDALAHLCNSQDKYKHLFEHHSRIAYDDSMQKLPRWDCNFSLNKHVYESARKIWVCGPPLMLEYFDRAVPLLDINASNVHII